MGPQKREEPAAESLLCALIEITHASLRGEDVLLFFKLILKRAVEKGKCVKGAVGPSV